MKIAAIVGNNIRRYRKVKGISQLNLGYLAEVDPSHINTIEHGRINVALLTLDRIAVALQITVAKLFIEPRGRKCK